MIIDEITLQEFNNNEDYIRKYERGDKHSLNIVLKDRCVLDPDEVNNLTNSQPNNRLKFIIDRDSALEFPEGAVISKEWIFCLGSKIMSFREDRYGPVTFQTFTGKYDDKEDLVLISDIKFQHCSSESIGEYIQFF